MDDLGLHLAAMAAWPTHERQREWLRGNDTFRREVLDLLGRSGPLLSRDIPDTCVVPWPSSGWTNNRKSRRCWSSWSCVARSPSPAAAWRVDPAALGQPFTGRTAVLSPFDRLVHDRVRLAELFEYECVLEMYKAKASRRWGYFALPILHGDRLVGKVGATADCRRGTLTVHAVHEDVPFTPELTRVVRDELHELACWLRLAVEGPR